MKTFVPWLILVALAAGAGWWARDVVRPDTVSTVGGERRVLYYQSAMHPWIRADRPGKCTICGMDLTPVYEGEAGFAAGEGVITLSSNSLSVVHLPHAEIRRQSLRRTLRVAGTIDDNDSRHRVLSAYVGGRLDRLFVNYLGAEVREGEPLAWIYSPELLTAVREYLALARTPGVDPAGPLLTGATQRLRQMGLIETQIADLPKTQLPDQMLVPLVSPMTGTVVLKDVYEGQTVEPGARLFELADFSTMWFQFTAYEQDLPWIESGQTVRVTVPAVPGRVLTNTVAFIDPNLDPLTRSARVRVELPNPRIGDGPDARRLLPHRSYAEGHVEAVLGEVLTVPRSAVLNGMGRPVVYLDRGDGAYEARQVRLGRWGDTDYEVLEGLVEGDRVVTEGALLLDGQAQIHVLPTPPPAPAETTSLPPLSDTLAPAVRRFLELADGLRIALAADDLAAFNARVGKVHAAVPQLEADLAAAPEWQAAVLPLRTVSHLEPAPDLTAARREFHAFTTAAVTFARPLRAAGFPDLKIYQCPMTRDAFPGAPARASWLQLGGPLRNPYFGAAMLDCGTEVKP